LTYTLLAIFLGIWIVVAPLFRVAAAGEAPPVHPATAGPIITDSAVPASPGQLTIQPYWSLSFVAGAFSPNWRRVSVWGDFRSLQIPLKVTYGLIPNLEIYAQMAFINNWGSHVDDPKEPGVRAASFSGVGDLAVTLKYQLLKESDRCPTVSAIFTTDFPTGHHYPTNPARLGTDVQGAGTYGFTTGANLSKWVGPVYLSANLWYSVALRDPHPTSHLLANPLMAPVHGRDLIIGNLAAEYPVAGPWVALLEYYGSWEVGPLFRGSHEPPSILMGVMPGIEYIVNSRWACELGVAVDLAGRNSLHGYTPMVTVILTF
jgi:hypothetical protein